jgi:tetratricopeptide (TPR) repeat protein
MNCVWHVKSLAELYYHEGKFEKAAEIYKYWYENGKFEGRDLLASSLATVYRRMGREPDAALYSEKARRYREEHYIEETKENYLKLISITKRRGIKLVLMQYPVRSLEALRNMITDDSDGVVFVSNENNFRDAIRERGFWYYFCDDFAGDFGHCTDEGNTLIAENLANAILDKWFVGGKKHG